MVRYQFADELVGLVDFNVQNPFVINTLALNHFSVVDTDGKQNGVHDLANNELKNLVLKVARKEGNCDDPSKHVQAVGKQEVSEEDVPHKEEQGDCQLNLKFVETSLGPFAQVLYLQRQKNAKHS